jgi:hypothetical protein
MEVPALRREEDCSGVFQSLAAQVTVLMLHQARHLYPIQVSSGEKSLPHDVALSTLNVQGP